MQDSRPIPPVPSRSPLGPPYANGGFSPCLPLSHLCVPQVHSPSSEMVRLFSHLLLLTGDGRLAFHGPMADALKHFETLGYGR